jgi:hypothetical protein
VYYLRLTEQGRCSAPENSPMSRYFTTQEEEPFKIGVVCFKCFKTVLCQGVKGRLEDVVLVEVGSVAARVSTLHD